MQWTVMDNGKGTDHAGLEKALQADIAAMQAEGGAMDMAGLERKGFEAVRRQMDGLARVLKAEECKAEGNAAFGAKDWLPSLVGYMAGIWFIQRGEQPCPAIVACESNAAALDEVPALLGAGAPVFGQADVAFPKEMETKIEELRLALHLNLAAAALRLSKYTIARTACEYVCMIQGNAAPPKARYRLAKAMEGQGEVGEAIKVLERLMETDSDNADAQKLLESLRERQAKEATAATAALPASKRYESLGAEDWAKMSKDEQLKAIFEINQDLDAEMGS